MTDQDKAIARWALRRKRLSIDQVEQIRSECDRSGRSFQDIAVGRGLLAAEDFQKPKTPPFYFVLIACSLLIFIGLLVATLVAKDRVTKLTADEALEIGRQAKESDRSAADASRGYKRAVVHTNEAAAREQLAKAREAMSRVDALSQGGSPPPQALAALDEAFVAYNAYLKELPEDAEARVERSRTHQLRRNYDLAVADLEQAIAIRPDLAPTLKPRIDQLRLFIARKPQ
jgi:tetratricopeptide (TPR) repeat protein